MPFIFEKTVTYNKTRTRVYLSVAGQLGRTDIVIVVWSCHAFFRDLVHRQTACWAVKHMALGVYGFGCDDALMHLFNLVWPNIFENSPHMVQAFTDAVDGCRVALGPTIVFQYTLQVCLQYI